MNKLEAMCEMFRNPMRSYTTGLLFWRYNCYKACFEAKNPFIENSKNPFIENSNWNKKDIKTEAPHCDFVESDRPTCTESFIEAVHDMMNIQGVQYIDSEDCKWEYDPEQCEFFINGNIDATCDIYTYSHLEFTKHIKSIKCIKHTQTRTVRVAKGPYITVPLPKSFKPGMKVKCTIEPAG